MEVLAGECTGKDKDSRGAEKAVKSRQGETEASATTGVSKSHQALQDKDLCAQDLRSMMLISLKAESQNPRLGSHDTSWCYVLLPLAM